MIARHRSIADTAVTARVASLVGLLALSTLGGCATSESRVRVIGRAGPVRDVAVVPVVESRPIVVSAGGDVLTDAELKVLQEGLPARLTALIAAEDARATTDPVGLKGILRTGTLTTLRLKLQASAGRERHRFNATCRLRVTAGDDVLVDVEGSTLRLVQARNVSVIELPAIEQAMRDNGGRNPLLDVEESEAALVDACRAAIAAILDDTRPEDAAVDEAQGRGVGRAGRREARVERRRRALARLEQAQKKSPRDSDGVAAALVDLGDTGSVDDAPTAFAFFHDEHPLVRRAAGAASTALCAGHALISSGLKATCTPPPPPPPPPAAPASDATVDDAAADDDDGDGPVRVAPAADGAATPAPPADPAPTPPADGAAPSADAPVTAPVDGAAPSSTAPSPGPSPAPTSGAPAPGGT